MYYKTISSGPASSDKPRRLARCLVIVCSTRRQAPNWLAQLRNYWSLVVDPRGANAPDEDQAQFGVAKVQLRQVTFGARLANPAAQAAAVISRLAHCQSP